MTHCKFSPIRLDHNWCLSKFHWTYALFFTKKLLLMVRFCIKETPKWIRVPSETFSLVIYQKKKNDILNILNFFFVCCLAGLQVQKTNRVKIIEYYCSYHVIRFNKTSYHFGFHKTCFKLCLQHDRDLLMTLFLQLVE